MSVKRTNDAAFSALVPVPESKKSKSEIVAYAAKNRRAETRTSSLFAQIVLLSGHESEVFCCKFSPDGSILASSGFDRKIFLWNVYGECENWVTMQGHTGAVLDLKFNKDGSEFVTCSTDKSVCIWDINTCERIKKIKAHKEIVNSVDFCRQSPNLLVTASDDSTVKLWDRRRRGEVMSFDSKYQVLTCCFNENGEQIVSGGIDNDIKVWDIKKNSLSFSLKGHTDSVTGNLRRIFQVVFLKKNSFFFG